MDSNVDLFGTVLALILGPPRRILLLVGWRVGDTLHEQFRASLLISMSLLVVTVAIWLLIARQQCGKRSTAARFTARQRSKRQDARCDKSGEPSPAREQYSFWTIHNKRYDLGSFVARHPGGIEAISLGQGYNCTELFESYHSLANEKLVRATLRRYYVEDAPEGAMDYQSHFDWEATPFYDALKAQVRAHFQQQRSVFGHRANLRQWLQLVCFVAASGFTLYGFMQGKFLSMLLLPFCYWWGPSPCMHDGGHFSLSRHPWVNRLLAHIGGAHMSLFFWQHQHTIGHHVETNIPGCDPDLYHFALMADTGVPGFRTSLELRTLPEHSNGMKRGVFWRIGVLVRMPFSTFGPSFLWDSYSLMFPTFLQSFLGLVPIRPLWMQGLTAHSIGRAIVLWLAVVHPIVACLVTASGWPDGIIRAIAFVVTPYAIHGCIFYVFSQVSHVQHECSKVSADELTQGAWNHSHPEDALPQRLANQHAPFGFVPDYSTETPSTAAVLQEHCDSNEKSNLRSQEWAIHQVESTLDYAVDSIFWTHVSNGLNLQVIHHLFPQVGWGHYRELSPIIRRVCSEFGVQYSTKPTFKDALRSHYGYLACINDEPNASVWVRPPPGRASRAALQFLDQMDAPAKACAPSTESQKTV